MVLGEGTEHQVGRMGAKTPCPLGFPAWTLRERGLSVKCSPAATVSPASSAAAGARCFILDTG